MALKPQLFSIFNMRKLYLFIYKGFVWVVKVFVHESVDLLLECKRLINVNVLSFNFSIQSQNEKKIDKKFGLKIKHMKSKEKRILKDTHKRTSEISMK